MTIEEIRKHKEKAEQDIRRRLQEFHETTGMCPVDVSLVVNSFATINSARAECSVGKVTIELEAI